MTSHPHPSASWVGIAAFLVAAGLRVATVGSAAASHRHEAAGVAGADPAGFTTSTSGPDRTSWLLTELARAGDGATIAVPPGIYRGPLTHPAPLPVRIAVADRKPGDGARRPASSPGTFRSGDRKKGILSAKWRERPDWIAGI